MPFDDTGQTETSNMYVNVYLLLNIFFLETKTCYCYSKVHKSCLNYKGTKV